MSNGRLDFSIEGVKRTAQDMRAENEKNKTNKDSFIDYIDSKLSPEWNTTQGQVAVNELRNFVNTKFQDYITYLDGKIDAIETVVVPALGNIDNA